MVSRWLWRTADTIVLVVFVVVLFALAIVFFIPMYGLIWLVRTISGEGHWCRQQRQRMAIDRPPLADTAFLEAEHVPTEDAQLWLAVRHAVADSVGLPPEAIYPQDQTRDLWRMQFEGPDILDVVVRLEDALGIDIPLPAVEGDFFHAKPRKFRQFGAGVVSALRGIQPKQSILQEVIDRKGMQKD